MNYKGIFFFENIRVLQKILGPKIELVVGDFSDLAKICVLHAAEYISLV